MAWERVVESEEDILEKLGFGGFWLGWVGACVWDWVLGCGFVECVVNWSDDGIDGGEER